MNPKDYPVEIRPLAAEDGGGWLATFHDLPGCMGDGETPEAAVADGYEAAQAWLSVAAECGDPIPMPCTRGESDRLTEHVMNTTDIPIETSSGNVYEDLGMADAAEMLVKAKLASKIADIIKRKNLTQQQAADLLAMPQPKVSMMLRGQFRGISESKMLDCLARLGRDIDIVVKPERRRTKADKAITAGRVNVVFA